MSMKENGRDSGHEQTEYFGVISRVLYRIIMKCEAIVHTHSFL